MFESLLPNSSCCCECGEAKSLGLLVGAVLFVDLESIYEQL
jgi:hypothetical protein